jgi:hypothetical protein
MLGGCRDGRARDLGPEFARQLCHRGDLWDRKELPDFRSGLALQILELRIGGDQPSRAVKPAKHRPRL